MSEQANIATDSAGWIEWRGGECPVYPKALVDVRSSLGTEILGVAAGNFLWDYPTSVVAYRLSDRLADERSEPAAIKPSIRALTNREGQDNE